MTDMSENGAINPHQMVQMLRDAGWKVLNHFDIRLGDPALGRSYWAFGKDTHFIEAYGSDDAEALMTCLMEAKKRTQ